MSRKINAPGFELNEIDRSGYNEENNNSIVGTAVMVNGFSSKGDNYSVKNIQTMTQFENTFGTPQTEAERYFYNAAYEVLDRGGVLFAARLPYDNFTLDRIPYVQYKFHKSRTINVKSPIQNFTKDQVEDLIKKLIQQNQDESSQLGISQYFLEFISNFVNQSTEENDLLNELSQNNSIFWVIQDIIDNESKVLKTRIDVYDKIRNYCEDWKNQIVNSFNEGQNDFMSIFKNFLDSQNLETLNSFFIECGITESSIDSRYSEIKQLDPTINSIIPVSCDSSGYDSLDVFDSITVKQTKLPTDTFRIYDITRQQYEKDSYNCDILSASQYLGVIPVVVSPVNAMYYQDLLSHPNNEDYIVTDSIQTIQRFDYATSPSVSSMYNPIFGSDQYENSLSKEAADTFPQLINKTFDRLERKYLKQIGIAVFQVYVDTANNNKLQFKLAESFVGSPVEGTTDDDSKQTIYICDIVNQNSNLINVYSNVSSKTLQDVQSIVVNRQKTISLGFYEQDCDKKINVKKSVIDALDMIFSNNTDYNSIDIDILADAGISNIAQFIASTQDLQKSIMTERSGYFDFSIDTSSLFRLNSARCITIWKKILDEYDYFCKTMRHGDCMFVADGPRQFCLTGNQKIVRYTKPSNTIDNSIIPSLKYMTDINTSYGAGYCDWFYAIDHSGTAGYFWCPPSIKAFGVYIYCDAYAKFWSAPAGINRATINDVVDVAFNPDINQAGKIYQNRWNYAVNYPMEGIVIEGQKTFQKDKTSLDRVNVRRLMLYLEKSSRLIAKRFNYEQITDSLLQQFRDTLRPIFEDTELNYGISEYAIVCDSSNNTTDTIDNNEIHCAIAVRPIKTAEYIVLNFIATNQSAIVSEVATENA